MTPSQLFALPCQKRFLVWTLTKFIANNAHLDPLFEFRELLIISIATQFPVLIAFQHDARLKQGIVGAQTKGQFDMIYTRRGHKLRFLGSD